MPASNCDGTGDAKICLNDLPSVQLIGIHGMCISWPFVACARTLCRPFTLPLST